MPRKTFSPEQIIGKLRQVKVLIGHSLAVSRDCSLGRYQLTKLLPQVHGVRRAATEAGEMPQGP